MKNNLKRLREARGLRLQDVEEMLNKEWGLSTIGNFENGKTAASARLVERLAEVLEVKPEEIDPNYKPRGKPAEVEFRFKAKRALAEELEAQAQKETRPVENLIIHMCVEYLRRQRGEEAEAVNRADGSHRTGTKSRS